MEKEKFIELVHALSERDSTRLLNFLTAHYYKNEDFVNFTLEKIDEIEKYNSEYF